MASADHLSHVEPAVTALALIMLALFIGAYLAAAGWQHRWSGWRTAGWISGVGLLALALAPPLSSHAHHDLRAHMGQHLLIGMFAPLGLILAAPVTLLLRTLPVPTARRAARLLRSRPLRWLSHPVSALILNVGGMYLLYLTPLYALSLHSPTFHLAVQAHFLAVGCLFTWAIAGPDPAPHRPGWLTRLAVLFVAIAAHTTLAKLMYAYGWPQHTPHDTTQIRAAAQLMYYGGDLAELLLAISLFKLRYRARPAPAAARAL